MLTNRLAMFFVVAGALALGASDQPALDLWKADELKTRAKALGAKAKKNAFKSANETVAVRGNQTYMVAHREGNGQAEWHETDADIIVIVEGNVTLVYGGTIVSGKPSGPGEIRGDSIADGKQVQLKAGDIFHIPAKTSHQMMVTGELNYFVAKVHE